jgi:hypothetical protein
MDCLPNRVVKVSPANQCYNPIGLERALLNSPTDPITRRQISPAEQVIVHDQANKLRLELGMPTLNMPTLMNGRDMKNALSAAIHQHNEQRARELLAMGAGAEYDWYELNWYDLQTFNWIMRLPIPLIPDEYISPLLSNATYYYSSLPELPGAGRLEHLVTHQGKMVLLIEAGADVNFNDQAETCLGRAVWADRYFTANPSDPCGAVVMRTVDMLLEAGARVDDKEGDALCSALLAGSIRMVQRLLEVGATPLGLKKTQVLLQDYLRTSVRFEPWFDPESAPYVTAHIAQIMASAREQRRAHP